MKCLCCGQEITSKDRYCPNCGENNEGYVEIEETSKFTQTSNINQPINRVPINPSTGTTNNYTQNIQVVTPCKAENKALGICAIIFSALGGWLGLVLSIMGLCNYKTKENRKLCKIGLWICIGWFVVGFIIGLSS